MLKNIKLFLFVGSLIFLVNCSSDNDPEENDDQTITTYSQKGLLGQAIAIEGENFEPNMVRVLFDDQQAILQYLSSEELMAIVPRSIERYNPTLRVIDLNDNTELLNTTFLLETPNITSYSSDEITFDETLTIEGEFFDEFDDAVKVKINDEYAEILEANYQNIQVKIPYNITNSELVVKVEAQLQEVTSAISLSLKEPIITNHEGEGVYWSVSNGLVINGSNFNPNYEYGEVFVNGISSPFYATNSTLYISLPSGPYEDFAINEVVYNTADLSAVYTEEIPLLDDKITVHISPNGFQHNLFTYNGEVYRFDVTRWESPENPTLDYVLSKFDVTSQSWSQIGNGYSFTGVIDDAIFDGNHTVYLYKRETGTLNHALSKLDLQTFEEEPISMPFGNNVHTPILIPFQDNLYFLSGLIFYDGVPVTVTDKYSYNSTTGNWSQMSDGAFPELPLIASFPGGISGKISYMHYNDKLYFYYGTDEVTYELNSDLSINTYDHYFYFEYNDIIFGGNYNYNDIIYNIATNAYISIPYGYLGRHFFVVNDTIYFHQGGQESAETWKLRTSFLSDLLN